MALVLVDTVSTTIGALPVTVARTVGIEVVYLPELAMRRIADLHPGNAKTDARDAYIIAEADRTMPHALRRVGSDDNLIIDQAVIVGIDDDLAGEVTHVSNRIRDLLAQIHPAMERAIGGNISHPAVLALITKFGGPTGLAAAGKRRLTTTAIALAPRMHELLVEAIVKALTEQTVVVPGTRAAELVLPQLAAQLQGLLAQRDEGQTGRGSTRRSPSFPAPDVNARSRHQDRCQMPSRRRRRLGVPPPVISPLMSAWPPLPADPAAASAANNSPATGTST